MIKTCFTPIIGFYNRRWTQYTKTGKIALCCIAKMENDYIRFFVEWLLGSINNKLKSNEKTNKTDVL